MVHGPQTTVLLFLYFSIGYFETGSVLCLMALYGSVLGDMFEPICPYSIIVANRKI